MGKEECKTLLDELNKVTACYRHLVVTVGGTSDSQHLREELKKTRKKAQELAVANRNKLTTLLRDKTTSKEDRAEYERLWVIFSTCVDFLEVDMKKTLEIGQEFPLNVPKRYLIQSGMSGGTSAVAARAMSAQNMKYEADSNIDVTDFKELENEINQVGEMTMEMEMKINVANWTVEAKQDPGAELKSTISVGASSVGDELYPDNPDWMGENQVNMTTEKSLEEQGVLENRSGVFLHSVTRISPCTSLDTAPITDNLKKVTSVILIKLGNMIVLMAMHNKHNALKKCCFCCLMHMFTQTVIWGHPDMQIQVKPIAVVLCPGWEKAQYVFDTLEEYKLFQPLNPMLILVGLCKEEAKNIKIQKGCQIIVTTSKSLVRLLSHHCFLFLRLCHLVFDEVDVLFSGASEQMSAILEHFKKAATSEERVSLPQQIIAVGNRWNKQIRDLVREYMSDPCVVITIMEEATLYGSVHQNTLEQEFSKAKSVLLLSEKNAGHVTGVLRYFEHADVKLPPELTHFAEGVLKAKEEQKSGRPLCKYLTCFGFCSDSRICSDRHSVRPEQDTQPHPTCGTVSVLPLYVENASCYFGRIVGKKEDLYSSLAVDMAEYYACKMQGVKEITKGGLYGIRKGTVYHRVQALDIPEKGDCLFCSISVRFIDEGRTGEVREHQLLCLPSEFQSLPPQAVEFIVCRVKPIDNEIEWNPKVSRHINQKIKGVQHEAKIVLCLGNTIWVDPMIRVTKLADLRTYINEYNVCSEIIGTGMGTDNPEHVALLKQLCLKEGLVKAEETQQEMNLESSVSSSVQSTVNSSDELPEVSSDDCNSTPSEGTDSNQQECVIKAYLGADIRVTKLADLRTYINEYNVRSEIIGTGMGTDNPEHVALLKRLCLKEGLGKAEETQQEMKIVEDKSTCAIKCNEPVITLVKEKKGVWQRLLQHKNTCVSLDFDHFDDLEEEEEVMFCNGGDTTAKYASSLPDEEGCYFYSDGESDSD
ncbi:UNVERIFIED_CONTAM: hypothetical protein FKN15_003463 [Acipenser sinensis]